jgi:4-hydroxy-tetrahydrodipicolinate synthase
MSMRKKTSLHLKGVIPALISPFDDAGRLNIDGLKENLWFLINKNVHGVMVNGCTGEAASLSREERVQVIKTAVKEANRKIPVIAGTGAPSTRDTLTHTKDAKDAGADAAMIVTPFFLIPNEEGLIKHYKTVSDNVDIPIVLYHIPQHTGVYLSPEKMANLCEKIPNMAAIKDSYGNIGEFAQTVQLAGDRVSVLTGGDDILLPAFASGAHGTIIALGNIAPGMVVDLFESVQNSELDKAQKIYVKLLPIASAISTSTNFPAPVKAAIQLLGRPAGPPRSPIVPVEDDEKEKIRKALVSSGLI